MCALMTDKNVWRSLLTLMDVRVLDVFPVVPDLLAPVCEEDILHGGALHHHLEDGFLQPGLLLSGGFGHAFSMLVC